MIFRPVATVAAHATPSEPVTTMPRTPVLPALLILLAVSGCSEDGIDLFRSTDAPPIAPPESSGDVVGEGPRASDAIDPSADPTGCAALDAEWPESWKAFEAEVVRLVNERRSSPARCGASSMPATSVALVAEARLTCASRQHSMDMSAAQQIFHDGSDGRSPFDRIRDVGYTGGYPQGENVAQGYPTPESVVDGWMNSDGHCRNIMNPDFSEIGVGYEGGSGARRHFWTQKFGNR